MITPVSWRGLFALRPDLQRVRDVLAVRSSKEVQQQKLFLIIESGGSSRFDAVSGRLSSRGECQDILARVYGQLSKQGAVSATTYFTEDRYYSFFYDKKICIFFLLLAGLCLQARYILSEIHHGKRHFAIFALFG